MNQKARDALLYSFAADALALGPHWIYNTASIEKKFTLTDRLIEPASQSYHSGKGLGEFTHYGDQTLWLLEYMAENHGFDLEGFARVWQDRMADYTGHKDGATKQTLARFEWGADHTESGSRSDDLAGASRMAPLVFFYAREPEVCVEASRAQTRFTHNHPLIVGASEFFCRVALDVVNGGAPVQAVEKVLEEGSWPDPFPKWVAAGLDSAGEDTVDAILEFGQMCEVENAFPSTIHLLAAHESDYDRGMIANTMAGGDSAARGMIAGMILAAHNGPGEKGRQWANGMKSHDSILKWAGRLEQEGEAG